MGKRPTFLGAGPQVRAQLEGAIQFLAAALVVAVAASASDIDFVNVLVARPMRWILLGELCCAAVAYALLRRRFRVAPLPAALAALLLGVAFASTAWSPDSTLTFGRSVTFTVLLVTGGALACGSRDEHRLVGQIMLALLAAAVAVAIAGVVALWLAPDHALVPATRQSPARYNGIGGNPNTIAMLLALSAPLGVWALLAARTRAGKALWASVLALFGGSLAASGSRGALAGALAGVLVLALSLRRRRNIARTVAVTAVAAAAVAVGLMQLPQPAERDPPPDITQTPRPLGPRDAQAKVPLQAEIGFPAPRAPIRRRSFFDSSGRLPAWRGALEQAAERPLAGYGFGTEERVFVDRYFLFYSSVPENSYIGALVQLGVVGTLLLLALLGALIVRGWRSLAAVDDPSARAVGALLGVVACGLVLAASQSYVTSAGSPASPTFWLCALLLATLRART